MSPVAIVARGHWLPICRDPVRSVLRAFSSVCAVACNARLHVPRIVYTHECHFHALDPHTAPPHTSYNKLGKRGQLAQRYRHQALLIPCVTTLAVTSATAHPARHSHPSFQRYRSHCRTLVPRSICTHPGFDLERRRRKGRERRHSARNDGASKAGRRTSTGR